MKIFVTGGTGYLGVHLVRALLQEGHQVKLLWHPPTSMKFPEDLRVEKALGDITELESVMDTMAGCEVVFHAAGNTSFWGKNKVAQQKVNINGTRHVVEACLAHNIKRLVHTSSVATLGIPRPGEIGTEASLFKKQDYKINYYLTKYLGEQEIHKGIEKGLDAVIVHPGIIFGNRNDTETGNIRKVLDGFLQLARRKFYSEGGICACDVEDVAQGHLLAFHRGKRGEHYILGGENLTYKQLFEVICPVFGLSIPRRKIPSALLAPLGFLSGLAAHFSKRFPKISYEYAKTLKEFYFYSSEKAIRELGYSITPFRETLQKIYQSYL